MKTELGIRNKEIFVSHCLEKLKESTTKILVQQLFTDNKKFWKRGKALEIKPNGIQILRQLKIMI